MESRSQQEEQPYSMFLQQQPGAWSPCPQGLSRAPVYCTSGLGQVPLPPHTALTTLVLLAVIQALISLVNKPEPDHPLRADLADEFTQDPKRFMRNAEDHTRKFSEKRPGE